MTLTRQNKQNRNRLRTVGEETIYVKYWRTDGRTDKQTDGRRTLDSSSRVNIGQMSQLHRMATNASEK